MSRNGAEAEILIEAFSTPKTGLGLGRTDAVVAASRIAIVILALFAWHYGTRWGVLDEFFVSTPLEVAAFIGDFFSSGTVWPHLWITVYEVFLGFAVGSVLGVLAGMLLSRFQTLRRILSPFLTGLNSLPRVALAPLFILWFGIGSSSKVWLAISLVFFIVMISTEAGLNSVDREYQVMGRVMGATERQVFLKVLLPGALLNIFAGLKLGMVYSVLAVVFGQMLAARTGLGQQLSFYAGTFRAAGVFGTLFVLGAFAMVLNSGMERVERHLTRWSK